MITLLWDIVVINFKIIVECLLRLSTNTNMLDKLKAILYKLLSMIPVVREFARLVEEKRNIRAASPYGYTPLGRLLKEDRTPLPGMKGLSSSQRLPRGRHQKGK